MFGAEKPLVLHRPVMKREVVEFLLVDRDGVYLDLTFGRGGHAEAILEQLSEKGSIYVVDWNREAFEHALRMAEVDSRVHPFLGNYGDLDFMEKNFKGKEFNGIIADLGLSMDLIKISGRGFSFMKDEPLDMRYGDGELTAEYVINSYSKRDLARIFKEYGEEKKAEVVAEEIVRERRKKRIETTLHLVSIIERHLKKRGRIHPATRIFQALRIEVNDELGNLRRMLSFIPEVVKKGSRLAVITYHSLEDRIVKEKFREWEMNGMGKRVVKKVIVPSEEEKRNNPASRSAKMRVFEFGR